MKYSSYVVHDTGTSHVLAGKPCQDAYKIISGDRVTVAAVADGLGSCKFSQISSTLAVESICRFLVDETPSEPSPPVMSSLMVAAMNHAYHEVIKDLDSQGIALNDAHTTLIAVAIFDKGLVWGQAGDGVAVTLCQDGSYKVLCEPKKGDKPNTTFPFTLGWETWHVGFADYVPASVMLSTDGIGDVVYPLYMRGTGEVINDQASFFMHPTVIGLTGRLSDTEADELSKATLAAIRAPDNKTWNAVGDDLTALVLIDTGAHPPVAEPQSKEHLQHLYNVFYDLDETPSKRVAPDAGIDVPSPKASDEEESITEKCPKGLKPEPVIPSRWRWWKSSKIKAADVTVTPTVEKEQEKEGSEKGGD